MKVVIDGRCFDTDKARATVDLYHHDGSNGYHGDAYVTTKGVWYVDWPSQWAGCHWEITSPSEILKILGSVLGQRQIDEIMELGKIEAE